MEKVKLSRIPLGKEFEHEGKRYVKTNHNRGVLVKEGKLQEIHRFKKYTKVVYNYQLTDIV